MPDGPPARSENSVATHPSLFDAIGGTGTCRLLSASFYGRVKRDPVLSPFFPGKTLKCAIEELSAFLIQLLGGPIEDTQSRWWLSLRESHMRFRIGQAERDAWMRNMIAAVDEAVLDIPARCALIGFFETSSAYIVKQGHGIPAARSAGDSEKNWMHREFARRWDNQRTLDDLVAIIRGGDAGRAIAMAEKAEAERPGFEVSVGAFALMLEYPAMRDYVRTRVKHNPSLVYEQHASRTLLHDACALGDVTTVDLLLELGANPNPSTYHSALYALANQCAAPSGASIVQRLVASGAALDAAEGAKRCTALHMAARRGQVEIAAALLDCGAYIDPRDIAGETPLRRAVNCNKVDVAALLVSRGANIHSIGTKGLTPLAAARSGAMRRVLQNGVKG